MNDKPAVVVFDGDPGVGGVAHATVTAVGVESAYLDGFDYNSPNFMVYIRATVREPDYSYILAAPSPLQNERGKAPVGIRHQREHINKFQGRRK